MKLEPPNENQLEFIQKEEFYQPPERIEEDVTQLIEWISKQPHLPNITDREWLSHFIVGCKYNLQRSKQVIDSYFTVRSELPEYFGSFTKEELLQVSKHGLVTLFPKLTPEGHRIFCTTTKPMVDDEHYDVLLYCKAALAILDLQLKAEPMHGNIIMYDLKHVRLSQFMSFTPTITKNLLRCGIDAFPLRVKAVHYVNPPIFMSRLLTFFKMFLPEKIKNRIFVHDTLENFYEYVPKNVLPDIYGGTAGNVEKYGENVMEYMMENKEWLATRPKADLSKRPEKSKSTELDMNGTFKQLSID